MMSRGKYMMEEHSLHEIKSSFSIEQEGGLNNLSS